MFHGTRAFSAPWPWHGWLFGLQVRVTSSCPIFHPPVSPSPSPQGCSKSHHHYTGECPDPSAGSYTHWTLWGSHWPQETSWFSILHSGEPRALLVHTDLIEEGLATHAYVLPLKALFARWGKKKKLKTGWQGFCKHFTWVSPCEKRAVAWAHRAALGPPRLWPWAWLF